MGGLRAELRLHPLALHLSVLERGIDTRGTGRAGFDFLADLVLRLGDGLVQRRAWRNLGQSHGQQLHGGGGDLVALRGRAKVLRRPCRAGRADRGGTGSA